MMETGSDIGPRPQSQGSRHFTLPIIMDGAPIILLMSVYTTTCLCGEIFTGDYYNNGRPPSILT